MREERASAFGLGWSSLTATPTPFSLSSPTAKEGGGHGKCRRGLAGRGRAAPKTSKHECAAGRDGGVEGALPRLAAHLTTSSLGSEFEGQPKSATDDSSSRSSSDATVIVTIKSSFPSVFSPFLTIPGGRGRHLPLGFSPPCTEQVFTYCHHNDLGRGS